MGTIVEVGMDGLPELRAAAGTDGPPGACVGWETGAVPPDA